MAESKVSDKHQGDYVCLLRGVNVGGNRVIKSTDLKSCFEKMGFNEVKVILQSGNVKFTSDQAEGSQMRTAIESGLTKQFDYPAKTVVFNADFLNKVIADYPFDSDNSEEQHYVVFLTEDLSGALIRDCNLNTKVEQVRAAKRIIYWRVQKEMTLKSDFGKLLSKAKYKDYNTVRNLNTLHKIVKA